MTSVIDAIRLRGQVSLPYVEQGDSQGVPVLFLHGYTDSWHSFEGVLRHLPGSIRAFAMTQRGHGDADRPVSGYHPRDFAADLAAFMDAQNLGSAVVVGHSMGGTIAQRFAIDYPERTLGLVLMGAFNAWHANAGLVEFWDAALSALVDPISPEFVRDFQQSTLARPVPPGCLETAVRESLKVPARVWKAVFEAGLEEDLSRKLGQIQCPTLIAWGDQDAYTDRSEQESLMAGIPGSQLLVYPGGGHSFHWEEPDRFSADLVRFIESFIPRRERGW